MDALGCRVRYVRNIRRDGEKPPQRTRGQTAERTRCSQGKAGAHRSQWRLFRSR
ncbi:MAG: hypothetical protein MZV63_62895 [Marinilabiliales bacterium]|nr:hypothetical protein [Marinilabiliales bacterium]